MNGPRDDEGAARQQPRSSNTLHNLDTPHGTRQHRRDVLRRALVGARRRNDVPSIRLLVRWLSDEAAA